jgi:hypothetical protein
MRIFILALVCVACMADSPIARAAQDGSVPREIGNRARGFSYQPTPGEVRPREAAAGLRPSGARQGAADRVLRQLDSRLLRDEGLAPDNVPTFVSHE